MEFYRDFYGCTASVRRYNNGSARLTVRSAAGKLIHAKDYASYRGAKVAMGRLSDGWVKK